MKPFALTTMCPPESVKRASELFAPGRRRCHFSTDEELKIDAHALHEAQTCHFSLCTHTHTHTGSSFFEEGERQTAAMSLAPQESDGLAEVRRGVIKRSILLNG
jgi:hypothetical protein